jgi:hypothetical protein
LETVVAARPDVFNHNLETVPGLYPTVRPGARYFHSLRLLQRVKELDPTMFTKSGIMVGLGEDRQGVHAGDGRHARGGCRFPDHRPVSAADAASITRVDRFVTPDEFKAYEKRRLWQGFPDGFGHAADPVQLSRRRRESFQPRAAETVIGAFEGCEATEVRRKDHGLDHGSWRADRQVAKVSGQYQATPDLAPVAVTDRRIGANQIDIDPKPEPVGRLTAPLQAKIYKGIGRLVHPVPIEVYILKLDLAGQAEPVLKIKTLREGRRRKAQGQCQSRDGKGGHQVSDYAKAKARALGYLHLHIAATRFLRPVAKANRGSGTKTGGTLGMPPDHQSLQRPVQNLKPTPMS